jgi:cysteine synthase A
MNPGILSVIGNTPLVQLARVYDDHDIQILGKLEQFNPGGSIKDRPSAHIIEQGLRSGAIRPDSTIIESSSGNMGIGLAQICAYHLLRFICVVDPKITATNLALLEAYNATIEMVAERDFVTGEYLPARIKRVKQLMHQIKNSYWPNQYASRLNSEAHYRTMEEIAIATDGRFDYLFCAASTCGTLRGCAEYMKRNGLQGRIVAVDAVGSVIFGGPSCKRLIPGHGASIVPELFNEYLADECVHVTDKECVVGCHRLLRKEALLAGGSSGAVVAAIGKTLTRIPRGSTCVAIFPDRGERYLDTIYSRQWVEEKLGEIPDLWSESVENSERVAHVV